MQNAPNRKLYNLSAGIFHVSETLLYLSYGLLDELLKQT